MLEWSNALMQVAFINKQQMTKSSNNAFIEAILDFWIHDGGQNYGKA